MTLYKYLPADRADIIELGLIRYTQPIYLNDPFEMTPRFGELFSEKAITKAFRGEARRKAVKEVIEKLPPQFRQLARILAWLAFVFKARQMRESMRTIVGTFAIQFRQQFSEILERTVRRSTGVLSLTARPDNLLMWSHYADQHRGFVVALNEQHPVFDERRSNEDEFNHLRQVVYSKDKMVGQLADMTGVDLLLRKSLEWSHEEEWRIVKQLESAAAMAITADRGIYLYALPPEAIQGIIFGAHMADDARFRIQTALYANPAYDHVWQKQAEVAANKFALNFFPMPGRPVQFAPPDAMVHSDEVDPETFSDLRVMIDEIVSACVRQPLDLSRLKDIHVSSDICKT
ncbi:MAG: DUF2971 domain-containing protein, partial [Candidatus Binatia bacterium]